MSLVNDMLRDLDRRKNASTASGRAKVVFRSRAGSINIDFKVLALMIMLGVMLGLAAGFCLFSPAADPEAGLVEMGLVAQISGATEEVGPEAGLSTLSLVANPELETSGIVLRSSNQ